ncbi:AAA family ATPase, partial [candidate division KSB1 bacterium]|nr:AAA family ATPase [candidate division KSB1 bacterium]
MQNIFIKVDEKEYGPVTLDEFKTLVREGSVSKDDLVLCENSDDWMSAAQIEGLKRFFPTNGKNGGHQCKLYAVASGKGGVGKTLLSVNLARAVSWSEKRVLLIDLDLYNRGSTTLVADKPIVDEITVAGMLEFAQDKNAKRLKQEISEKEIVRVLDDSDNPVPIYLAPSTSTNSIVRWDQYSYDVSQLKEFMLRVVRELTKKYHLDCVVFDCRPGPEPLFLAAAGIATDIILVTEADIITLNGNINLYRYLEDAYQNNSEVLRNVRFVINRIPRGQDITHIESRYMKRQFDLFKTMKDTGYDGVEIMGSE